MACFGFLNESKGLLQLSTSELKDLLLPLDQYSDACPLPSPTLFLPVSQLWVLSLPLYSLCSGLTDFLSVPLSAPKHPKLISASGPVYVLSLCLECFLLQPFMSNPFRWFRFQQFSSLPANPLIAIPLLTSAIPYSFSLYEFIYSTSHHLNLCMSVCIVYVHKYYLASFH